MNSRLNVGGFSVPQDKEFQSRGPWVPVTPQTPVPVRPNATPSITNTSLPGSSYWWELANLQNGYLEEIASSSMLVQNLVKRGKPVQMPSYGRSTQNLVQSEEPVQALSYGSPVQNLIPNVQARQRGANLQNNCVQQIPSNGRPLGSLVQSGRLAQNDANIQYGRSQELPSEDRLIENLIKDRTPVQNESNIQDRYLQEMFTYGMPVENSIHSERSVQNEANNQDSYLQELSSCSGSLQNDTPCGKSVQEFSFSADTNSNNQINAPIATSFTELLTMEGTDWGNGPISDILASENAVFVPFAEEISSRPLDKDNIFPDINSSAAPSSYGESSSRSMLSNQNGVPDEIPEPSQPMYDLNLIPGTEADDPQIFTNSFQFAPPTPEQAKLANNQPFRVLNSIVDDNQDKQKKLVLFTGNESSSNLSDELLQSIVDSSKRKEDTAIDRDQGIDLNKTPQLKPPKRKKHRPKVVVEGKPKRSKKSTNSEKPQPQENTLEKRKYVCRTAYKESECQQPVVTIETTDDKVRTAGKSCRRALNFDLEKTIAASTAGRKEIEQQEMTDNDINASPQSAESSNLCEMLSDPLIGIQKKSTTEHQVNMHSLSSCSMDQRHAKDHPSSERLATSKCPLASNKDNEIDIGVTTKAVDIASDINWPNSHNNIGKAMQQYGYIGEQMAHEGAENLGNLAKSTQLVTESITKPTQPASPNYSTTRKNKRDHYTYEQVDLNMNSSNSSYLLQQMFQMDKYQNVNRGALVVNKKNKIEKRPSAENHVMHSCVPLVQSSSRQDCIEYWDNELRNGVTSGTSQPYAGSVCSSKNTSYTRYPSDWYLHFISSVHCTKISAAHHLNADRKEDSSSLTQATHLASQEATQSHPFKIVGVPETNKLDEHHSILRAEASGSTKSGQTKKSLQHRNRDIIHEKQYSIEREQGSESTMELMDPISIDGIIEKLKVLNLSEKGHESMKPTETAIVPYNGDGRIVPYEIRKRKPRPKVNLDPETNRMWNLLMGKEASEGCEEIDMEKENWWRNEREVFHGRANSFIARMHLVQGDRRFSPWKGSIVDSVIGVFLTQNVSDHLSSSAFMSLAARFPARSRNSKTSTRFAEGILVEQPNGTMVNPTDIIRYHPNIQPICNSSSTECWRDGAAPHIQRTNLFVSQGHNGEEEVISSQDSFQCPAVEGNGAFGSYSGFNSESEDFSISHKYKTIHLSDLQGPTAKEKSIIDNSHSHLNRSTLAYQTPKNRFQQPEDKAYDNQNPRLDRTNKTNPSPACSYPIDSGNIVLSPPPGQHNLQLTLNSNIPKVGAYDVLTEESISSWLTASKSTIFKEVDHTVNQTKQQLGSNDQSRVHPQELLHSEETFSSQCILSSRNIMQQQSDCHLSIDTANSQPTFSSNQCQMKFSHPDASVSDVADRQFDIAQYASTNPNHIQTVTGESTATNIVHPKSKVPHSSSAKHKRIGVEKCGMCEALNTSSSCFPSRHKCRAHSSSAWMGPPATAARNTSIAPPRTVSSVGVNTKISLAKIMQTGSTNLI